MRTMRPFFARIIPVMERLTVRKVPVRFVSTTDSNSSSFMRMSRLSAVMPALATTTSTGPSFSSISEKARSMDSVSVTSAATARAPLGACPLRGVTATRSPCTMNSSAMVRPMPRLPPVTRTVRGSDTDDSCSSTVHSNLSWTNLSCPRVDGYDSHKGRVSSLAVIDRRRIRSEEHTSELQSRFDLVCRLLLEKKKKSDDDISRPTPQQHYRDCELTRRRGSILKG